MSQEPVDDDRELVVELTGVMLERVAPDELAILPEISDDYFADPEGSLRGAREESLGFGVELALLAPFALSVATEVVKLLLSLANQALGPQVESAFSAWVRKTFPHRAGTTAQPAADAPLTREQLLMVHKVAYDKALNLGLKADQATSLADAVVGGAALAEPAPPIPPTS